jgi:hypothetical protein
MNCECPVSTGPLKLEKNCDSYSIKVVPEQSGKVKYERERLAGNH